MKRQPLATQHIYFFMAVVLSTFVTAIPAEACSSGDEYSRATPGAALDPYTEIYSDNFITKRRDVASHKLVNDVSCDNKSCTLQDDKNKTFITTINDCEIVVTYVNGGSHGDKNCQLSFTRYTNQDGTVFRDYGEFMSELSEAALSKRPLDVEKQRDANLFFLTIIEIAKENKDKSSCK